MDKHFREPIKHTCPDIDKLIKEQHEIFKIMDGYSNVEDVDVLKDIISDIENILWNYESELEKLRRSNDELRTWGISEAKRVDELENELESLK